MYTELGSCELLGATCKVRLTIKSMMHCIRCLANLSHGSKLSPKEPFSSMYIISAYATSMLSSIRNPLRQEVLM